MGIDEHFLFGDVEAGAQHVLQDAERELQWRYGWTIPVRSLRYWALGIPDPSVPATTELDEQGRLQTLEQNNWRVEISTCSTLGNSV